MKEVNFWMDENFNSLKKGIEVNFKQTRKGQKDIVVVIDGYVEFEVHYPADGYDTPYGIALPNEDEIRSLSKDRKAKSLFKKYKSSIEKFVNS